MFASATQLLQVMVGYNDAMAVMMRHSPATSEVMLLSIPRLYKHQQAISLASEASHQQSLRLCRAHPGDGQGTCDCSLHHKSTTCSCSASLNHSSVYKRTLNPKQLTVRSW